MRFTSWRFGTVLAATLCLGFQVAWAGDTITIKIPRHSSLTLVQHLNREGVEAVQKHDYTKASELFYKAYLFDPADPFTLNNLGYISELEGQLDRAREFYKLAAEQGCNASIDFSNVKSLEGEPMQAAIMNIRGVPVRVNRVNADAVNLLSQDRGFEAASLLQQALSLDPHDAFTLNNLGVASEATGDFKSAMRYYTAAADSHSSESVVVTRNRSWQGKSVSEMAAANARRLEEHVGGTNSRETQAFTLSAKGVIAQNENDWPTARQDFMKAYDLDPANAFSLNNRGYVAERDGDLESAQFFYAKARQASGSNLLVGLATNMSAQGQSLSRVATDSRQKVDDSLDIYSQERRGQSGPVELTPRGGGAAGARNLTPQEPTSPNPSSPITTPETHQ